MSARKDYMLVAIKGLDTAIAELDARAAALAEQANVKLMQRDAIVATLTPEQKAKLAATGATG